MKLTDAEIAYLLQQPGVASALERFNRAQALQSADQTARMEYLKRVRAFETMERRRG